MIRYLGHTVTINPYPYKTYKDDINMQELMKFLKFYPETDFRVIIFDYEHLLSLLVRSLGGEEFEQRVGYAPRGADWAPKEEN